MAVRRKDEVDLDAINRSFQQYAERSSVFNRPVPTQTGLDPRDFAEDAPLNRPAIPEITEELPPQAYDGSILSSFASFADRYWPDDSGGLIRGTSGWLENMPVAGPLYRGTVGAIAGTALSAGSVAIDVMNWGSDRANNLGAVGLSTLPGGAAGIDYEQAQDISFGQVRATDYAIRSREGGFYNTLVNVAFTALNWPSKIAEELDSENIMFSPDFDYEDEAQRKEAFESGGWGSFTSGYTDGVWLVAADPTIAFGGGVGILTKGSRFGKFGGLTNQALRDNSQIDRFARVVEDQASVVAKLGVDGARSSGRLTGEGENLIAALQGNADDLIKHPWVKGSSNPRDTVSLLASTSVDDPVTAGNLVGAMAGDMQSWGRLRMQSAEHYDALTRAFHIDILSPPPGAIASTDELVTAGIKLTDEQIRFVDDLNFERLASRPELLEGGGQMLFRGGSRLGPQTTRAANAWRTGALRNQFENNPFKKTPISESSKSGHFVYDTIEGVAGSRPVEVIRWLGRGRPNGLVNVKDGPDGAGALNEVTAWLRRTPLDEAQAAFHINRFAAARTVQERTAAIKAMEYDVFASVADEMGYTPSLARKLYEGYDTRRGTAAMTINKSETHFAYDELGKVQIYPQFYGELDQAFPLLDVRHVREVLKEAEGMGKFMRGRDDLLGAADYVNSMWKISVLMRAGYTQRNFIDNALRSFAVLGLITTNPRAWAAIPANAKYYAKARRGIKDSRAKEKLLLDSYDDLLMAREVVTATLSDARYADLRKVTNELHRVNSRIRKLERSKPSFAGARNRQKVQKEIDELKVEYRTLAGEQKSIRAEYYEPLLPEIADARAVEDMILQRIDELGQSLLTTTERVRRLSSKRKIGGKSSNVMPDGTVMPGAFQGFEGEIAALASSSSRTVHQTFNAAAGRRIERLEASADFRKLDPKELQPGQMQVYFDEYSLRLNRRYRGDDFARLVIENKSIDELRAFFKTPAGTAYLEQMSLTNRPLRTAEDVDAFIFESLRRIDYEVPKDSGLRAVLLERDVSPGEIAAALRGKDLPIIPGRLDDGVSTTNVFKKGKEKVDNFTNEVMRWLGTIPEDKLLRHPFYNNVYSAEQFRLFSVAMDQGLDTTSAVIQNRINRSAHQFAIKSTRETMYTIERLSNAAYFLRFVSPFFPAWENAVKTWGRISWNNPAVPGFGNILWNIPNNMGLVIDEDGNPVEKSNMLMDEGNYVIMPELVTRVLEKDWGAFEPFKPFAGEDLQSRQNSFNVIFPGPAWWFSGIGPFMTAPVTWLLRGKPEDSEVLRNFLGDEMFRQFVPGGTAQADITDLLIPTAGRRVKMMLNGTDVDSAYVNAFNIMIEDLYIQAQLEDRSPTEQDVEKARKKFENYWSWLMGSAVAAPVQFSRRSKFATQRAYWGTLIDDTTLSFDEKVRALNAKFPEFGDALTAVTRSTSYTETKLRPTLETWQRITKNPDLVDQLYRLDPELVGMFGNMGLYDDPWSYAVYGEFGNLGLGPGKTKVRRKLTAEEITENLEIADGYREFQRVQDHIEEKVIELGYSSLQVKAAEPLRKILDDAEIAVGQRYPRWKTERDFNGNQDKIPMIISGAKLLVANAELINEDSTMATLWTYLQVRDEISNSIANTNNSEEKEQYRQIGYEAAFQLRQRDIGFADFYDQYLFRDDFRSIG